MGLFNSLFGGSSLPKINVAGMQASNNASAQKQDEIASGLQTNLSKLNDPYKANTHQTGLDYQNESRAASQKFLDDIGSSSDKLGENLSSALYRRTMAAVPQQNAALREQLAATGGLQRGGADAAFVKQAGDTASNLFEGNTDIINNQLGARQDAMKQAYGVDQDLIKSRLGIDQDTLGKLYASGRQDLIDEANSLLGIEGNRNDEDLSLQGYQQSADLARAKANADRDAGLSSALLGVGGTLAGAAIGGPVGASVGSQVGTAAGGSPRGTVNPAGTDALTSSLLKSRYRPQSNLTLY